MPKPPSALPVVQSCEEFIGLTFAINELSKRTDSLSRDDFSYESMFDQISMLDPSQEDMLRGAMGGMLKLLSEFYPGAIDSELMSTIDHIPYPPEGVFIQIDEDNSGTMAIRDRAVGAAWKEIFMEMLRKRFLAGKADVFLRSLLTTLVGSFEVHMNELVRFLLTVNPALVGKHSAPIVGMLDHRSAG